MIIAASKIAESSALYWLASSATFAWLSVASVLFLHELAFANCEPNARAIAEAPRSYRESVTPRATPRVRKTRQLQTIEVPLKSTEFQNEIVFEVYEVDRDRTEGEYALIHTHHAIQTANNRFVLVVKQRAFLDDNLQVRAIPINFVNEKVDESIPSSPIDSTSSTQDVATQVEIVEPAPLKLPPPLQLITPPEPEAWPDSPSPSATPIHIVQSPLIPLSTFMRGPQITPPSKRDQVPVRDFYKIRAHLRRGSVSPTISDESDFKTVASNNSFPTKTSHAYIPLIYSDAQKPTAHRSVHYMVTSEHIFLSGLL